MTKPTDDRQRYVLGGSQSPRSQFHPGHDPKHQHRYMQPPSSRLVGFSDDCEAILAYLPGAFTLADLDAWEPWLQRRHPTLTNHRRKLLDQIQRFQQAGLIQQTEQGTWKKQHTPPATINVDIPLAQGDETHREELARILQMDGPTALQRGMFKPASGPFKDQLLLFHDPHENPYGDVVQNDVIRYVGQGQQGDQKLASFNRYLAEHLKRGYQVHFFEKQDHQGTLNYRGEVVCENVERVYRPEEQRSVLEFKLIPAGPLNPGEHWTPTQYYETAKQDITTPPPQPSLVHRPQRVTLAQRLVRNVAFRDTLLDAYERRCAVCGTPLELDDLTELEAAHIVAITEQGPDDPRNGLCLCVRHHWAFDHGVFTLTDDLEVQTHLDGPDPHQELEDGATLQTPQAENERPHPFYVKHHREKWSPIA